MVGAEIHSSSTEYYLNIAFSIKENKKNENQRLVSLHYAVNRIVFFFSLNFFCFCLLSIS